MIEILNYVNLILELDKARKEMDIFYPWAIVSFNGSDTQVDLFWADKNIEVYGGTPFEDTDDVTHHPIDKAEEALKRAVRRARGNEDPGQL